MSAPNLTEATEKLRLALDGDASVIDDLRQLSQSDLSKAAASIGPTLRFGRPAALRVMRDLQTGDTTDEQARWWALLMFAGGFPQKWTPYGWELHFTKDSPEIDIDYSDDEAVNEVVFRLKDNGDVTFGPISPSELETMIQSLLAS